MVGAVTEYGADGAAIDGSPHAIPRAEVSRRHMAAAGIERVERAMER